MAALPHNSTYLLRLPKSGKWIGNFFSNWIKFDREKVHQTPTHPKIWYIYIFKCMHHIYFGYHIYYFLLFIYLFLFIELYLILINQTWWQRHHVYFFLYIITIYLFIFIGWVLFDLNKLYMVTKRTTEVTF